MYLLTALSPPDILSWNDGAEHPGRPRQLEFTEWWETVEKKRNREKRWKSVKYPSQYTSAHAWKKMTKHKGKNHPRGLVGQFLEPTQGQQQCLFLPARLGGSQVGYSAGSCPSRRDWEALVMTAVNAALVPMQQSLKPMSFNTQKNQNIYK